ncbi:MULTISPECIES: response regulator [Anaerosinus]|uniref:Response regulator transcription factor n=1 Tax=Selenobaculum gibii TaxID=3054208 RepID=A0A9Y2AI54_9FIRM|nr:response regulator transcription factor [Selenobaculum gbiensis]WIW70544.1 response regulator transcription factor [Selenobaculum gbiensis]
MIHQTILVIEDDIPVRNLITTTLETQDYKYYTAENGTQALLTTASVKPDVILLDLGLPDIDGIEVIRKIRSWSDIPIIVISARSDERDKIEALDSGADDYLTKPFSVEELLARLRVVWRRLNYLSTLNGKVEEVFHNGALVIDFTAAVVKVNDTEVKLMPIEYKLLCLLAKNVGKVLTHHYILDQVWKNAIESDLGSLRVYMTSLRKKLCKSESGVEYIQTHIGIGYRMLRIE